MRKFMPTYTLIALNIAIYIYTAALSGNFIEMNGNVITTYGQDNQAVFNGAYWQLFT